MISAVVTAETKPIWTSSSFLIYAGGLTVLGGAAAGIAYLARNFDSSARALWALLFLGIVYGTAHALLPRDRWLAAGILAFVSVILWGVFLYYLFRWWGWNGVTGVKSHDLREWSWSRLLFWLLVLASAWYDRMRFKFPFVRVISAVVSWLFIADLLTSGKGNWFDVVTLFVGLVYLLVGSVVDKPSAFWLHVVGGALIGSALLDWFHTSDFDFAVISVLAVLFVLVGYWTRRSSWAVYGTIGFFAATVHYVALSFSPLSLIGLGSGGGWTGYQPLSINTFGITAASPWSPALAFGLLGFWLILLGMLGKRPRKAPPVVVTVETTEPAV